MPRIPPSVFWHARRISPYAPLLLPICRDLQSALTELHWIQQHVADRIRDGSRAARKTACHAAVWRLCRRRGRGEPLQYVLGTQPFGALDLLCRRGVLIPRPEPEAYSLHLADLLLQDAGAKPPPEPQEPEPQKQQSQSQPQPQPQPHQRILDICTGTGCIALVLYSRLRQSQNWKDVQVWGIDVSPEAVALAQANRKRLGFPATSIHFYRADVFENDWLHSVDAPLDVLVCNPPYISADGFAHDTARSVRLFEPKLAQVPRDQLGCHMKSASLFHEDVFYARLWELSVRLDPRIVLCEVGGEDQARRVAEMAIRMAGSLGNLVALEIWADCPDIADTGSRSVLVAGQEVAVRGSGTCRSVFVRRR